MSSDVGGSLHRSCGSIFVDERRVAFAQLFVDCAGYGSTRCVQVMVQLSHIAPDWEPCLPRLVGKTREEYIVDRVVVDLRLEDGTRFVGCRLGHPWLDRGPVAADRLRFQLGHPDLQELAC